MPEHQQTQQSTESKTTFQKQATFRIQAPFSHPMAIIQRARVNPKSLTHADVMQLQQTIGNRAVGRLLSEIGLIPSKPKQAPPVQRQELVQRQEIPEEEEPLQGKMAETVQLQEIPEEEVPLQGKFESIQRQEIPKEEELCPSCMQRQEVPEEEEPLQGKFENKPEISCPSCFADPIVQRQEIPEEEEPLQGKMIGTIQRQEIPEEEEPLQTKRENNTGMPDNLKAGVENLSGIDMSDVRVHYNSSKPAEVGALAYTQGANIHVAPGQERHLPHEAWHVVQQKQGRVQATTQMKGLGINDDPSLELEADMMGAKMATNTIPDPFSASVLGEKTATKTSPDPFSKPVASGPVAQLELGDAIKHGAVGVLGGTVIGATLGSFVPVVGTSLGSLIGGVIGGVGGFIHGELQPAWGTTTVSSLSGELGSGLASAKANPDVKPNPLPAWVTNVAKSKVNYNNRSAGIVPAALAVAQINWGKKPPQIQAQLAVLPGGHPGWIATETDRIRAIKQNALDQEVQNRIDHEFIWNKKHDNRDGKLPGVKGLGGYKEYYAEPSAPDAGSWGRNRVLKNITTIGKFANTWFVTEDHYKYCKHVTDA